MGSGDICAGCGGRHDHRSARALLRQSGAGPDRYPEFVDQSQPGRQQRAPADAYAYTVALCFAFAVSLAVAVKVATRLTGETPEQPLTVGLHDVFHRQLDLGH